MSAMADRQLELWINERWYDTLEKHFGGEEAVQQKLENMLDGLIDQLPDRVRDQVSREIREEDRQQREAAEAAQPVSVFRVTQNGRTDCLLTEGAAAMDALRTALRLRFYLLAKGNSSQRFIQAIPAADHITPEDFQDCIDKFRQSAGRLTAALDIDLDQGRFSALDTQYGWETYTVRDVSTAAWRASQKDGLKWERRLEVFAAHLEGKEITPEHRLDVSQVSFADEIMEMDGLLNFYVPVDFDPDHAFGANVCTDDNDDWVNVYANYDMGKGQVCGVLEINLCRGDGTEKAMRYPLSTAEKKTLAGKMDAFCQKQTGLSLKDYCAKIQAEDILVMGSEKGAPVPDAPQKVPRVAASKKASKARSVDRGAR